MDFKILLDESIPFVDNKLILIENVLKDLYSGNQSKIN